MRRATSTSATERNRRIQVFDGDGTFLRQFTIDVPFKGTPNVMLGADPSHGQPAGGVRRAVGDLHHAGANPVSLRRRRGPGPDLQALARRKVLGVFGEAGKEVKQFGWIHEIACPSENELYVAELLNWRMQKLTLHP